MFGELTPILHADETATAHHDGERQAAQVIQVGHCIGLHTPQQLVHQVLKVSKDAF